MMRAMTLGLAAVALFFGSVAQAAITIDGAFSPADEWTAHLLGTSITAWEGGTSVDVYGFIDGGFLYAAYKADVTTPGWATAEGLGFLTPNLSYNTPLAASWPDPGFTALPGYEDQVYQTDGSDWAPIGTFADNGVEVAYGQVDASGDGYDLAEVKIPLALLAYGGTDGSILLDGQYWGYDGAEPFIVSEAAVPEPSSVIVWSLIALSFGGATWWRRRKRPA